MKSPVEQKKVGLVDSLELNLNFFAFPLSKEIELNVRRFRELQSQSCVGVLGDRLLEAIFDLLWVVGLSSPSRGGY